MPVPIAFLDRATFAADVRFPTEAIANGADWRDWPFTRAQDVIERAHDSEVVLVNKVNITSEHFASLPRLKLVALTATGTDNVDLAAARVHGVAVANVRGYAVNTVPEHVFALTLALRRSLVAYRNDVRDGRWSNADVFSLLTRPIRDLAGSALGVVGSGSLGSAVARLGKAFGMKVMQAERRGVTVPRPGYTLFDHVLSEADVVTLHVPLTPETRHLIGASEFARMKHDSILINTARGALVDPVALVAALKTGRLGGAGIDVLDSEPPPPDHPLLVADLPNLLVTPHVAWASLEAQQRLADEVMANVAAFLRGEPRNRVV